MDIIKFFTEIIKFLSERLLQMIFSILGGLFIAFEATTILFFMPCMLTLIIDILSANSLAKRVKRKYPEKADGKFKSSYKHRVLMTIIIVFIAIILGHYIDTIYFNGGIWTQLFVMGVFMFYEIWSVLENWSSENDDNKIARALQRIMVNKAERHINVEISDIMFESKEESEDTDG